MRKRIIFHIDVNNAFLSWSAVDLLKHGYKKDIRKIPSSAFPKNITGVIENTCFNAITNSQTYQKIKKWMANKKKKYKIQQCYIIGSILMYPEQAKDVDIIVCTPNIKGILDNLNILEFDFKIEFNKTLHISYFEQNNQKYIDFCNRNKYKIEI